MKKLFNIAQLRQVALLALADLRHEWRMSLCLMLAVAAIASPLLLFFGMKYGTIETLRKRLLDNPVTLEIMPVTEKLLDQAWFDQWRNNPHVAFVVPHTRKLSAQADLSRPEEPSKNLRRADIQPSLDGDTLLLRYGLRVPAVDECVLSQPLAEQLAVAPGERVRFSISRDQARVRANRDFTVIGVLPLRASRLPLVYIPLSQLEAIEAFKDGRAVPAYNWPGSAPLAYPVLPELILTLPEALNLTRETMLAQNTGFAQPERLNVSDPALMEWCAGAAACYRLKTVGGAAGQDNLAALRDKLRGLRATLIPAPSPVLLEGKAGGTSFTLGLLPATAIDKHLPNQELAPELPLERWSALASQPVPREILVSPKLLAQVKGELDPQQVITLRAVYRGAEEDRALTFSARLLADSRVADDTARAPLALLGVLNLLTQRPLVVEQNTDGEDLFLLGRRGYSGFRMYAKGLHDVAPLASALESEGIKANTRADRIDEVMQLDYYLNLLFWLIATASLVGGTACLLASIYANVERKRRDLAVLRLLGVHGGALSLFPLVSGLTLTCGGLCISLMLFHLISAAINLAFRGHLDVGEQFCRLTIAHQAMAMAIALGLATLAGLVASRRFARIDPAESLRDE